MKIKPYFKTELAEPYQGKYYHEVGASVVMNMKIKTKNVGDFMVQLPDPVSLSLNNAQNNIDRAQIIIKNIDKSKKILVFSKKLSENEIRGLSSKQIKERDPEAEIFRDLDKGKVFAYMQISMGVVISLVTAIESFVNLIIPYDHTEKVVNRGGVQEVLDKETIVRRFSIEQKIMLVAELKKKNNIKQQNFWKSFKEIKKLRNEVIHFKKKDPKIDKIWTCIVESFFDSDFQGFFIDTVSLINFLDPTYLSYE